MNKSSTEAFQFLKLKVLPTVQHAARLFLWVEPDSLYGRQVVTRTVVHLSFILAFISSATNLINSFGFFPIALAVFRRMGFLSLPFAFSLALLLNVLQNQYTSLLVRRGEYKRLARAAVAGLIALQIAFTSVSTAGGQLIGSPFALGIELGSQILTTAQTDLHKAKQTFMKSAMYLETKQNCEDGRALMDKPPPASERDRVILETIGSHRERELLGISATPESFCGKWLALQQETHEKYSKLDKPIEEALSKGITSVQIVKEVLPDQYKANFTPQGTIADGDTEIAIAIQRAFSLLFQGSIGELGTSLLLFLLSSVTSVMLVLALLAYARHPAVVMSFSEKAGRIKRRFDR